MKNQNAFVSQLLNKLIKEKDPLWYRGGIIVLAALVVIAVVWMLKFWLLSAAVPYWTKLARKIKPG